MYFRAPTWRTSDLHVLNCSTRIISCTVQSSRLQPINPSILCHSHSKILHHQARIREQALCHLQYICDTRSHHCDHKPLGPTLKLNHLALFSLFVKYSDQVGDLRHWIVRYFQPHCLHLLFPYLLPLEHPCLEHQHCYNIQWHK